MRTFRSGGLRIGLFFLLAVGCGEKAAPAVETVVRSNGAEWVQVTDYHLEAYWAGQWNPFADPYLAYRWVPSTRWISRTACRSSDGWRVSSSGSRRQNGVDSMQLAARPVSKSWVTLRSAGPLVPIEDGRVGPPNREGSIGGIARLEDRFPPARPQTAARPHGESVRK